MGCPEGQLQSVQPSETLLPQVFGTILRSEGMFANPFLWLVRRWPLAPGSAIGLSLSPNQLHQGLWLSIQPPAPQLTSLDSPKHSSGLRVTFHKISLGHTERKDNVDNKTPQLDAGMGVGSCPFVKQPLPPYSLCSL